MHGSETYDEIAYSLDGTLDYEGGKKRGERIDIPVKQSGIQRPTFRNDVADAVRKLIGLA